MMIVGVSGSEGAGKTTVCRYLAERHGFIRGSFTEPMNHFLAELYGFTVEQLSGESAARNEVHPKLGFCSRDGQKKVGMAMRDLYQDTWVDWLFRRYADAPLLCIENVRFANEIAAVKRRGGYLIRCRGGVTCDHPSETEQLSIPDSAFDCVLERYEDKRQRFEILEVMLAGWRSETER